MKHIFSRNFKILVFIGAISTTLAAQKNEFKVDLLSFTQKGVGISYERMIGNKWAVELGYKNVIIDYSCVPRRDSSTINFNGNQCIGFHNTTYEGYSVKKPARVTLIYWSVYFYAIREEKHCLAVGITFKADKRGSYSDNYNLAYRDFYGIDPNESYEMNAGPAIIYKFNAARNLSFGVSLLYTSITGSPYLPSKNNVYFNVGYRL